MVNRAILSARLERLREYFDVLEACRKYDEQRFVCEPFIYGTAERNLHLTIECLLDIGNHVISDRGYPKPESYADVFRILAAQAVIPAELFTAIEGIGRFSQPFGSRLFAA